MQRELIDKYFRNECSEEERKLVLEYFRDHPEEWNKYANDEDWDNFETNEELDPRLADKLYRKVSEQTFKKPGRTRVYWAAAAISTAVIIGAVWSYFAVRNTYMATNGTTIEASGRFTEKRNDSDTLLRFSLDDGSIVVLSPHSSIRYHAAFLSGESRTVHLLGKALFQANADRNRPFIVYADRLATTVLGTSFTIESFAESTAIKVKLHSGKIQVAAANTVREKWNGKEILKPGDEFIYDKTTMLASVKRYTPAEKMVKAGPADHKDRNVRRPDSYTFDISPLSDVFDQLSVYYQVDIYYYPSDIQNKYFSGRMRKTDSLETILNDIAVLNQLKIEKKQEHYIVSKKD
ncbi:FecR domain-containing protein [Chitinophaga filiformis]|uniref:FecR family protein n=1 Tax=Chitinophaga filiformis TaxID=104663 RepID=UPI001F2E28A9|nr:FecR domain-containing protein [Chitinophaga filiformis]MCF6403090.1 FecR domain-containing protein [Chitinophaga filiformis]